MILLITDDLILDREILVTISEAIRGFLEMRIQDILQILEH
jgi:hypothetical protein